MHSINDKNQLLATFRVDKKMIAADLAYIILNWDKKIMAISSSCIKMLSLDSYKVRKLLSRGIDMP
jgi:hypothetical protein